MQKNKTEVYNYYLCFNYSLEHKRMINWYLPIFFFMRGTSLETEMNKSPDLIYINVLLLNLHTYIFSLSVLKI